MPQVHVSINGREAEAAMVRARISQQVSAKRVTFHQRLRLLQQSQGRRGGEGKGVQDLSSKHVKYACMCVCVCFCGCCKTNLSADAGVVVHKVEERT